MTASSSKSVSVGHYLENTTRIIEQCEGDVGSGSLYTY
jgi:hypothetical protein